MRPIKLTVEGFISFRNRQTLDFSQLDLFAITGKTGAGKTSLLDAITYALYGEVSRSFKGQEFVSKGADRCKVELQFSVQQNVYKIVRSWRYRPSSPKVEILLDRWENGKWERCDRSLEKDILRMDFETFTRVIILPQGKFDEFLKKDAPKRRSLLRDLGGFQILENMSKQASELARTYEKDRERIENQLATIQAPTEDEIRQKQEQRASLENQEIPQLQLQAEKARNIMASEEELFKQIQRRSQLRDELSEIEKKAAEIDLIKQQLQLAKVANNLQVDWVLVRDARTKASRSDSQLQNAVKNLNEAQSLLVTERQKRESFIKQKAEKQTFLDALELNLERAKIYEQQRKQYQTDLTKAAKITSQRLQNRDESGRRLADAETQQEEAKLQWQNSQTTLTLSQPGGKRLEQLNHITEWLTSWQLISSQTLKLRQNLETTTQNKLSKSQNCEATLINCQEAEVSLESARTALETAIQNNHAAVLRLTLHDGDTCPVCSHTYSDKNLLPVADNTDNIEQLKRQKNESETKLLTAQQERSRAEATLETLQQQELKDSQNIAESESLLNTLKQQISAVLDSDKWEAEALNSERQVLQKQDATYSQTLTQHERNASTLRECESLSQSAKDAYEQAVTEYQGASTEQSQKEQQLQEVTSQLNELTQGKPYEELNQTLRQDREQLERQKIEVENSFQAAERRAINAEYEERQAQKSAEDDRNQCKEIEQKWAAHLQAVSFTEIEFIEAKAAPEQQEGWQNTIDDYARKTGDLSSRLNEITDTIGDRTTNQERLAQLKMEKESADKQINEANQQLISISVWTNTATNKLQQAKELDSEKTQISSKEQVYKTLKHRLQSDEFQAFVIESLEKELVSRATIILGNLTESRYSLLIQNGEYEVEDNWNGGESRRLRTLSGGETFAASISMALALSEKLSMGVELGSLFLDEGFGTLDTETLESVTQILVSLQQQNRLIGVITHIQALAEQLPSQVKVHNCIEKGSTLEQ
jgi:DNA repair protein SbcC/Rad50